MADISKIRLGNQGGTYTEYDIKDAAARQAAVDLDERVDGIEQDIILGGVYDVSAKNSGATFASLSALLSDANLSTLIPTAVRKGGMTVKFVQSSDNQYVEYLYKVTDAATAATFTNVANWEKINLENELILLNDNLSDFNYTKGKYISSEGTEPNFIPVEVSAPGYVISDAIPVNKNATYRWYGGFERDDSFTPKRQLLVFDSNDVCLTVRNYYGTSEDAGGIKYQEINSIPTAAAYVKVSFYIDGDLPAKFTDDSGNVLWEATQSYKCDKNRADIGDISELETADKTNLVAAINYLEQTKNTDAKHSVYTGSVDADNVEEAIDILDDEIDAISDSYQVPGNLTDNKILTVQDGNLVELDNDGFIISDVIVYTNNTYIRWYAGQDDAFDEPKPKMIIYVDGQTPTTDNAYNYYGSNVDNDGNHYTRIKRGAGSNRVKASFKKGGVCKITDDEGNILWSPDYGSNIVYVSSEKVLNPTTRQSVQSQIDELKGSSSASDEETKLFLGSLVNGTPTDSADISSSTTHVCMQSLIRVPFMKATLRFKLPIGIIAGVRSGNSGVNASTSQVNLTENLANGDTFTFGDDDMLFRIFFKRSNGNNLSPQEIYEYIEDGILYVTYNEYCPIVLAQSDCDKYAKAMMVKFHTGSANMYKNFLGNIPVFAHISDIHGDAIRLERFMQYCDSVGVVDAALNSGDTVAENFKNGLKFNEDIANAYKTLLFTCVGNHDTYNNVTEQGQYENVMAYQDASKYDVTWSNETYPTSFYRDFANKKIRLIVLNQWTAGAGASPYMQNMSQAQVDMLVGALKNCPEDYGIIVMSHNTENPITKDSNYAKFFQDPNYGFSYTKMTNSLSEFTTPITDIIDAYIGKTAIDKEYIANTNPQTTITVDEDFASSYGEFICWVCGHNHNDFIGYNNGSVHKQLILAINCGGAIYGLDAPDNGGCQSGDVPRGGNGATQDSFNIYAMDRDNKTVKVARIGSNMTYDLKPRDYMVIPYAD